MEANSLYDILSTLSTGLKIALKFLTFTYQIPAQQEAADVFWNGGWIQTTLFPCPPSRNIPPLFIYSQNSRIRRRSAPYFLLIGAIIVLTQSRLSRYVAFYRTTPVIAVIRCALAYRKAGHYT
jgi:hypothetical protein